MRANTQTGVKMPSAPAPTAIAMRAACYSLIALCALAGTSQASTYCYQYGNVVELAGTLVRQTHAGPPDYESPARGDEARVTLVVLLDRPICAFDARSRYPRVTHQEEVQLAEPVDPGLLGKRIRVTGQLTSGAGRAQKLLTLTDSRIERIQVTDR